MKKIIILILFLLIPLANAENLTEKDIEITSLLPETIVFNQTYTDLFKLTNLNHTSGTTDAINTTIQYQITNTTINSTFKVTINSHKSSGTGEFQLEKIGNFTLCGEIINSTHPDNNKNNNIICKEFTIVDPNLIYCNISINIITDKEIYNNSETIKINNLLSNNSFPFIIEYWVEDLFQNIVKSKTNTTNLNQKSYTPNIEEKEKTLIIKNKLYLTACQNSGIISTQKILTIKNNITYPENSTITITSIPDDAEFGDTINIDLSVYKGNTAKQVIYLWLESDNEKVISEKSKVKVLDKYTEYSFSVPIQIKPDCDDDYETDFYNLIAEGLDQNIKTDIKVKKGSSSLCKTEYIEKESTSTKTTTQETTQTSKFTYSIQTLPEQFYINQSFNITLNFTNTETQTHNISVHAYIYDGKKCFSLTRTYNNYSFKLPQDTSKLITLEITNNNTTNQSYNLKIRIKKNNLKTYKEITTTLPVFIKPDTQTLQNNSISLNSTPLLTQNTSSKNLLPTGMLISNTPNITVFESDPQQTTHIFPYILAIILLLAIILVLKLKTPIFSRR